MKIVPVIDLLNGVVVHAVKGKRAEYQPLKSSLCDSADPMSVALAFKACGFRDLYVADLDAILGEGANVSVLSLIVENTGLRLMVDAGISELQHAQELLIGKMAKVIVGTETLSNLSFIREAVERFGSDKVTVSLDLKKGKVLSKSENIASMNVFELASKLQEIGVLEVIVLDLARVGSGEGVDFLLLTELRRQLQMSLFVGGGVRDIADLLALKKLGVNGVLLSTALHSGRISVGQLQGIEKA